VYGQPSPQLQKSAFTDRDFTLYELSRLVIQTKTKNAASFLIARSLKLLPKPSAVVSYADTEYSHCGIVYQATNWIYTGSAKGHSNTYIVDGVPMHEISVCDKFKITSPMRWAKENNIEVKRSSEKHRYFYINADKRKKREILAKLKYPIVAEYPKCDQNRYDDGPVIEQPQLFTFE
jgi:hypothetical protein